MTEREAARYGKWIRELTAEAERFDAIHLASPRGNTAARGRAQQLRSVIALYKRKLIEAGMDDHIPRYGIETKIIDEATRVDPETWAKPLPSIGKLNRTMQGD